MAAHFIVSQKNEHTRYIHTNTIYRQVYLLKVNNIMQIIITIFVKLIQIYFNMINLV